jgi:Coenzyme PQQ synthesis protein D (PqqD)
MITLKDKIKPDPDVVVTELDDNEAVLLHLETKMYYTLNETGIRIWQLLSEGHSIGEASETIHHEYDVLPEAAQESVFKLAQELIAEKLANQIIK